MKTLAVLFAGSLSERAFDACFGGQSAFSRALSWAKNSCGQAVVLAGTQNSSAVRSEIAGQGDWVSVVEKDFWSVQALFAEVARVCAQHSAAAVLAFADCPFLSETLTRDLAETHGKYLAEYTFADGYPYGLAPEIMDGGTAAILANICGTAQKQLGLQKVERNCVWSVLKTDVNSFEIETLLAPEDFRLLRLSFDTGSKRNFLACRELYAACFAGRSEEPGPLELSRLAAQNEKILRTLPAFYNVALTTQVATAATYLPDFSAGTNGRHMFMPLADFERLAQEISDFSEDAVVSLSCWGEPLLHPQFAEFVAKALSHERLSLLIETDGNVVTEELCQKLKSACREDTAKITWIVTLDAATEDTYKKLRRPQAFEAASLSQASLAVPLLAKYFSGQVYPQLTRLDTNEGELEAFYRFWSAPDSPSLGKVLIQKYDCFCGTLPDRKPADLSPVARLPCWHLRRDMTVLCDGSVPRCREFLAASIAGNVFAEGVEAVWKKMSLAETGECGKCDEYYTYNF